MYFDGNNAMYVSLYLGYHCICVCTECVDYIVLVAGIDDGVLYMRGSYYTRVLLALIFQLIVIIYTQLDGAFVRCVVDGWIMLAYRMVRIDDDQGMFSPRKFLGLNIVALFIFYLVMSVQSCTNQAQNIHLIISN